MTRRPGSRLAAAAVAASVGCAALILGVLASVVTTVVDVEAASATATGTSGRICVGIAIDGSAGGGSTSTGCARVPAGDTGIQVLEAAGHTVTTRDDGGFVCSIDDVPASGCSGVDADHYWTYWHRAPGSTAWAYSSEGAGSYRPAAGSTEGWVYDNGATARHPNGVGQLCATPRPKSSPSPTASASPTRSRHPSPPAPKSSAGHGGGEPATWGSPSPSSSATAGHGSRGDATKSRDRSRSDDNVGRPPRHHRLRSGRGNPGGRNDPGPSPTRVAAEQTSKSGGGSAWEVAVAVVAIALLGGATLLRFRRPRP